MNFDGAFTRDWVERFADSVRATESELTELDQRVGDGDFGVNLLRGLSAAVESLDQLPLGAVTAAEPLERTATVFLDEVGGTSGPLFGLLFQELASAAQETEPLLTTTSLADGADRGLAAIQRVGEAALGDKTLIDALAPAAEAIRHCGAHASTDQAFNAAAQGAWKGVRDTALLRARRGRASYLGDRVSGVPDPGAVGIGLLFTSAERKVTELAPLWEEAGVREES